MRPTSSDRRHALRLIAGAGLGAVALLAGPGAARADALDDYRASGVIAERFDGFVELRGSGPAAAAKLVEEVNAKRRQVYAQRAAEQNVSPAAVAKIYAAKIFESAPAGTYFRNADGSYARK